MPQEQRPSPILPTVVITGASRGIGRNIAVNLAVSGKYKLALLARNVSKLDETVNLCTEVNKNVQAMPFQCDISNTKQLTETITKIGTAFGPFAVLINNAGVLYSHFVDKDMEIDKINNLLQINLNALIIACKLSVPYLKQTKSFHRAMNVAIIQISSKASTFRSPDFAVGNSIYCASKFAVRGFSNCLFKELKDFGIKVCQIMPGMVNTEMTKKYEETMILENMIQSNDISYAVNFILNCPDTCCPLEILLYPQRNKSRSRL
eukprot:7528_1